MGAAHCDFDFGGGKVVNLSNVCCHRGRCRSPLTAAAALGRATCIAPLAELRRVAALHAPAHFSIVSLGLAAACWLEAGDEG